MDGSEEEQTSQQEDKQSKVSADQLYTETVLFFSTSVIVLIFDIKRLQCEIMISSC